jgi:hypothetical protein
MYAGGKASSASKSLPSNLHMGFINPPQLQSFITQRLYRLPLKHCGWGCVFAISALLDYGKLSYQLAFPVNENRELVLGPDNIGRGKIENTSLSGRHWMAASGCRYCHRSGALFSGLVEESYSQSQLGQRGIAYIF